MQRPYCNDSLTCLKYPCLMSQLSVSHSPQSLSRLVLRPSISSLSRRLFQRRKSPDKDIRISLSLVSPIYIVSTETRDFVVHTTVSRPLYLNAHSLWYLPLYLHAHSKVSRQIPQYREPVWSQIGSILSRLDIDKTSVLSPPTPYTPKSIRSAQTPSSLVSPIFVLVSGVYVSYITYLCLLCHLFMSHVSLYVSCLGLLYLSSRLSMSSLSTHQSLESRVSMSLISPIYVSCVTSLCLMSLFMSHVSLYVACLSLCLLCHLSMSHVSPCSLSSRLSTWSLSRQETLTQTPQSFVSTQTIYIWGGYDSQAP